MQLRLSQLASPLEISRRQGANSSKEVLHKLCSLSRADLFEFQENISQKFQDLHEILIEILERV